jgi:hypothetical protein
MMFGGQLLDIPHPEYLGLRAYFGATGVVMIVAGLALLIRFLRTYPLPSREY